MSKTRINREEAVYRTILVTLDATDADRTILDHIRPLAKLCKSKIVLLHVADGWAARTYGANAVSPEITEDQAYLAKVAAELIGDGIPAARAGEGIDEFHHPQRERFRACLRSEERRVGKEC